MLKRLWNRILNAAINWTLGLGDRPAFDSADDWECGPQGAGYLPIHADPDAHEPE